MAKYASIFRADHTQNYTLIDNQIIDNLNLTSQARFLLIFLLRYNPTDGFIFTFERISKKTGISVSKTRALVRELQDAGYIKLSRMKEGNLYGYYHWDIFEVPQHSSESQDIPVSEPVIISKTEYNFNRLWESYPSHRRGDRTEALKSFSSIPKADDIIEDILQGLEEMKGNNNWLKEQGRWIPGLKKFLDNKVWIDGLNNPSSIQGMIEKDLEVFKNAGY